MEFHSHDLLDSVCRQKTGNIPPIRYPLKWRKNNLLKAMKIFIEIKKIHPQWERNPVFLKNEKRRWSSAWRSNLPFVKYLNWTYTLLYISLKKKTDDIKKNSSRRLGRNFFQREATTPSRRPGRRYRCMCGGKLRVRGSANLRGGREMTTEKEAKARWKQSEGAFELTPQLRGKSSISFRRSTVALHLQVVLRPGSYLRYSSNSLLIANGRARSREAWGLWGQERAGGNSDMQRGSLQLLRHNAGYHWRLGWLYNISSGTARSALWNWWQRSLPIGANSAILFLLASIISVRPHYFLAFPYYNLYISKRISHFQRSWVYVRHNVWHKCN